MVPTSRNGETHEFNLFPFKVIRHSCWHKIFLNMTIWEVWERLDKIYEGIFDRDQKLIHRYWLSVCKLPSQNDLKRQIEKVYNVKDLKNAWVCAFGGEELSKAEKLLKYMMLFMIFGSDMACPEKLFNENNLSYFFEEFPLEKSDREWAFQICFGACVSWQNVKSGISEILRQSPWPCT